MAICSPLVGRRIWSGAVGGAPTGRFGLLAAGGKALFDDVDVRDHLVIADTFKRPWPEAWTRGAQRDTNRGRLTLATQPVPSKYIVAS